ncbi:hypothetical protein [Rothia nasimurium]|uniref:hypothetical protein n=1 Tax=Rothia nasimurium TaxID=85336 RepID=UPI001F43527A|nr:hypothetical protein [Rothia nasimurium]
MSENPYTPNTPSSQPSQPGVPASPAGAYAAPGQYPYQDPYAAPQQPNGKKPKNVLGLVALGLGVLGFILALIPIIKILGWALLIAAIILGIIGLFQQNREKISAIVAICLASGGLIISILISVLTFLSGPTNQVLEDGTVIYPVYSATLEARADGKATLLYTDINGDRQEVEFTDYVSVEAQVDNNIAAASVLNGVYTTGMPSCSFIEPEGYDFIRFDTQDSESDFNSYICSAVVREEK